MPRLAGKRSNTGLYIALAVGVLILLLVALEFFNVINVIPGF